MRIFFVQLFKLYTIFLVVNATILVLGAPLKNEISVIPLSPLQKRLTIPVCPAHHPVYVESECESTYSILITCNNHSNPPDTDYFSYPCLPRETCIQFYVNNPNPDLGPIPHAYCIANERCSEFDNSHHPSKETCSKAVGYKSGPAPIDIEVALIIYSHDEKPVKVNDLVVKYKNNKLDEEIDRTNLTVKISGYNQYERIQFCFTADSDDIVTGYGSAQKLSLLDKPGSAELLDMEPL